MPYLRIEVGGHGTPHCGHVIYAPRIDVADHAAVSSSAVGTYWPCGLAAQQGRQTFPGKTSNLSTSALHVVQVTIFFPPILDPQYSIPGV